MVYIVEIVHIKSLINANITSILRLRSFNVLRFNLESKPKNFTNILTDVFFQSMQTQDDKLNVLLRLCI